LVPSWVTVTFTPGRIAPLPSCTTPYSVAVVTWPRACTACSKRVARSTRPIAGSRGEVAIQTSGLVLSLPAGLQPIFQIVFGIWNDGLLASNEVNCLAPRAPRVPTAPVPILGCSVLARTQQIFQCCVEGSSLGQATTSYDLAYPYCG